ncbi:MAG: KH domain-containing protein [Spirochaetales bacterium]|nr:KH domain-containing protein [Spirochaetales bacterium]
MEKDFIEYIAKALVDNPEGVMVKCLEGTNSTILELKVMEKDIGKIIGKHGRIIMAIRTILGAATARKKKKVILEVLDK